MKLLLIACLFFGLTAADTLDFGRGVIVVTATATEPTMASTPPGLSARAIAVLSEASYDRTWSVAAWLASHAQARRKLERMSYTARTSSPHYLSDGSMTVDYEFALQGPVLRLLMPPTGYGRLLGLLTCPTCGQAWPEGREVPAGVRLEPPGNNGNNYTGILVDATGLGLAPSLFPRVVTEEDDEVIGPGFFDVDAAANGPVGWFTDRSQTFLSDRVGSNPLVVRGIARTGANGSDVVISRYDAARVHGSKSTLDLVEACKVGILTDAQRQQQ